MTMPRWFSDDPILGWPGHRHLYLRGGASVSLYEELKAYAFDDSVSYDCVPRNSTQQRAIGPTLKELGFTLVLKSKNPNTGNSLHLYVRSATK